MRRGIFIGLSIVLLPIFAFALTNDYAPQSVGASANPEIHINKNGTMQIKSAQIVQVVGTTFFLVAKWGQLPMRFAMKTNEQTKVTKRYGGTAVVSQIKLGDYIDADGEFFVGSDFFGLTAAQVKNWSMQEESETFSGKIKELNSDNFLLETPLGKTVVVIPAPTLVIKKGAVMLPWSRIRVGDSVVLADGVYDYAKNTLTASQLVLFQAKTEFMPRNYQGTLKSVSNTAPPAFLVVAVDGVDYTVQILSGGAVLGKNRSPAMLARFVAGDLVRFYGVLREAEKTLRDELVVDAEVVRNLSL